MCFSQDSGCKGVSFVPTARVTRSDDSGAKSAVLGFPQVEHLFKTAHQADFGLSIYG